MQEILKASSEVQVNHIYPSDCSTDVCIIEIVGKEKLKLFSCGAPS